jgi:hypothetical protein
MGLADNTEMSRIQTILFGVHSTALGPLLMAVHRVVFLRLFLLLFPALNNGPVVVKPHD